MPDSGPGSDAILAHSLRWPIACFVTVGASAA